MSITGGIGLIILGLSVMKDTSMLNAGGTGPSDLKLNKITVQGMIRKTHF